MTDSDIMPFGKHQGKAMIEVPDAYLKWLWEENVNEYNGDRDMGYNTLKVMDYINDSFTGLPGQKEQ